MTTALITGVTGQDGSYLAEFLLAKGYEVHGVATGECHTVREFCERAFAHAGLDYREHVEHDPRYERPTEVDTLIGYAENARRLLGWEPRTTFGELVEMMVDADLELARREAVLVA